MHALRQRRAARPWLSVGTLASVVALVATAGWVAPQPAHAWARSGCVWDRSTSTRIVGLDASVGFWNAMAVGLAINHWNDADPPLKYQMSYNTSGADIIVSETTDTAPQPAYIYECGGNAASAPNGTRKMQISTWMMSEYFSTSPYMLVASIMQSLGLAAGLQTTTRPAAAPRCSSMMDLENGFPDRDCQPEMGLEDLIGLQRLYTAWPGFFDDASLIIDQINGRVLTAQAPGADGIGKVTLRDRSGGIAMKRWSLLFDKGSWTTGQVVNADTRQCLSVFGGVVETLECRGLGYQRWRFEMKRSGVLVLYLVATDEVLDVPAFAAAQGVQPITYPFNDGSNQWWRVGW